MNRHKTPNFAVIAYQCRAKQAHTKRGENKKKERKKQRKKQRKKKNFTNSAAEIYIVIGETKKNIFIKLLYSNRTNKIENERTNIQTNVHTFRQETHRLLTK
jgi:hypothetical protein